MAQRAIGDAERRPVVRRVYRVAVIPADVREVAEEDGLTPAQVAELVALRAPLTVLDAPFGPSRYRQGSRFSDGSFPVFYSAEDIETARLERGHHVAKQAAEDNLPETTEYFGQWSCEFNGELRDLVPFRERWPELTADEYPPCQLLAKQARLDELDALRTPSARHAPDGVCLPVFTRHSLSALEHHGLVAIIVSHGTMSFKMVSGS